MAVVNAMVGATTPDGATIAAKVDTGPVRVAVADNPAMASPTFFGPVAVDANNVAKVTATGLPTNSRFWWQVEDNSVLDTSVTGQFRTHPTLGEPGSYTIGAAGDAGLTPAVPGVGDVLAPLRLSNHPVFDTIRTRALAEDWLMFVHLGDWCYYDPGSGVHVPDSTLATYRRMVDDILLQPRQGLLYQQVASELVHDDHERGPNDHDGTFAGGLNFNTMVRERIPGYPLAEAGATDPLYRSFSISRVLYIVADVRSAKSPPTDPDGPSKTMLGAAQKAWMDSLLATSDAEALVWVMPGQFTQSAAGTWADYLTERAEMVEMFGDHGWLGRMCQAGADAHANYIITANFTRTISPLLSAHFPQFHFASLDAEPSAGPQTDTGPNLPGRGQYGTLRIRDLGSELVVIGTGWTGLTEWRSHAFAVTTSTPSLFAAFPQQVLSGSHAMAVEARVVTSFDVGDDPPGVDLAVAGGDVQLDGTAEIRATLQLDTPDMHLWPRGHQQLLAPFGNEVFVRRGVDLGTHIAWVPLGYYRITTPEQDDAPDGLIRLSCQDRMATLVDSQLMEPRQFTADRTVASVFDELVREIYPAAIILFDDGGTNLLGRQIIAEQSRYGLLHDVATSQGKIMFWDGVGILRVVDPPPEDTVVWEVAAGRGGVQLTTGRRLTREGVHNAVVATGEGGDATSPVRGVAVDNGISSPTRFGGPFGRVPLFYSSPLLVNSIQARDAAQALLRRSLGAPYAVSFGAIVNPALRPYDVVRITLRNGDREVHVVDRLTIPLVEDQPMTGDTRLSTVSSP